MPRLTRITLVIWLLFALVIGGVLIPASSTARAFGDGTSGVARPLAAAERIVTLVGSLQSELGCAEDWRPDCAQTRLTRKGAGPAYQRRFEIPAGSYELKVAVGGAWEENYGAGGVKDGGNIPLVLAGPATVTVTYDDETHRIGITPHGLAGLATDADRPLARDSLRPPLTRERFYFVMADRFANGSTANDNGGLTGGRLATGFDPTDKGFFHGGDLVGLRGKLDYIKSLGTTAIWLTPSFANRPVQGSGVDVSAGYHGYWVTDFTRIDPHLGTNADMKALIDAAHAKGMKVFFDIITNHTADVIDYQGGDRSYVSKEARPYTDAQGTAFDDATYAAGATFPAVAAATSFPYVPVFRTDADRTVKVPAWLNDPTMYHNRGDSQWQGESALYGDFVGLDDLWTERPEVVNGMTEIYRTWADMGIDGYRIDTMKHVGMPFWQRFTDGIAAHNRAAGRHDFFMFGEVFDGDPAVMSQYTTAGKVQATLDFGFQSAALAFAQSAGTSALRDFYAADDRYTDADSNAYQLPAFLGNHDMGRVGFMLGKAGYAGEALLARTKLAHSLMYLTRGQPVVYYGDEQGFAGAGGDKDARQDMFATKVAQYAGESLVGGGTMGSQDRYATSTPMYRHLAALAKLRAAHPALADGAQIPRFSSNRPGVFAVSRLLAADGVEYLVVANNATTTKKATLTTYTPNASFRPLYGFRTDVRSDRQGRVSLDVAGLSVAVLRADQVVPTATSAPPVYVTAPAAGGVVGGQAEIRAALPENRFAQVTMAYRPVGTSDWTVLGTDDHVPYRVFHDVSGLAKGTLLEYRAVAKDLAGNVSASSSYGVVGDAAGGGSGDGEGGGGGGAVGPVTQPGAVSVPGTHNTEMGCAADWAPDCAQAQLTLDAKDGVWKGTHSLPAGAYDYKAAIDRAWTENYGAGGTPNGANIAYRAATGPVTFYYDHRTRYVTSDAQGPIVTAPGSYQSELGCPADWTPDCMTPWLQDPDGDGTYTWSSTQIPAGRYEFKVAHGLSWAENYGAGGAKDGTNVGVTVPADGAVVTISYVASTHIMTVTTSTSAATADLAAARAYWVAPDLLAWPADGLPQGADARMLSWRLHTAAQGGLAADAETLGGTAYDLVHDPQGLPDAVATAHPELKGYLALRLDAATAKNAWTLLRGQLGVAMYDDRARLLDASGVQIAKVIDAIFAPRTTTVRYGATWSGGAPSLRLWAPTAQQVDLLLWPAGAAGDTPVDQARRITMRRQVDGSWTATGGPDWQDRRYLYEVTVFAPSTGKVEKNLVTDPYSVALTVDSTRSVLVDLDDRSDPAMNPEQWRTARAPALAQAVDQAIYELHIRDFSASDENVPAEHRGRYLAFADDGNGSAHLRALVAAGLNTIHLLPSFDIATIIEDPAKRQDPQCDLASYPPDSSEQQKCIGAAAATDAFNWGYDPWHYLAPEGSYASSAQAADGAARIGEFRTMVGALHANGLRVVLDQVYNHTTASGQDPKSVLDRIVPGYYHRLDAKGAVTTSTCCANTATEHAMMQRLMVDAVVHWARHYKIDGFRFDLMGHHSLANMKAVRAALDALTVAKDGVDGTAVTLYGEGWNFGEVANNARFRQASQGQLGGTGIGTFSDRLRDAVRGGGPFDEDPRIQGLGTGAASNPNGAAVNGDPEARARRLAHDTDLVQLGMAGNLRTFSFRSQQTGHDVTGATLDYNGSPAGYADEPDEVVSYVDAHDNETLFDTLTLKLPVDAPMADRVRLNTVALATVALGQGIPFWHAGTDLLRSKSLDRNSYDSGDWFNLLDVTGQDNGFGRGLPPEKDNGAKWDVFRPLLGNAALKPAAADIAAARAQAQDLLKLRGSTPLFRLGSAERINAKVSFPVSGTTEAHPGVIAMRIDDTVGGDVDPALDGLLVVVNAGAETVDQRVPDLAGAALTLSPVQAGGSDPIVREASWEATGGTATVPARTVAVFIHSTSSGAATSSGRARPAAQGGTQGTPRR